MFEVHALSPYPLASSYASQSGQQWQVRYGIAGLTEDHQAILEEEFEVHTTSTELTAGPGVHLSR